MRVTQAATAVAFATLIMAAPALAQGSGALPPPVPVPGATVGQAVPNPAAPNDAAPARQPGLGERDRRERVGDRPRAALVGRAAAGRGRMDHAAGRADDRPGRGAGRARRACRAGARAALGRRPR